MKWLILIIAGIVVLILLVYLIGKLLPVQHTATVVRKLGNSPDVVWQTITDCKNFASWRRGLKLVKVIDDRNWTETSNQGDEIHFKAVTWEPQKSLTTKIMNDNLPFGGQWVYEFTPSDQGVELRITENGEVYNPIFRFMSKYIFRHDTTLKNYMEDLEKKLGKKP